MDGFAGLVCKMRVKHRALNSGGFFTVVPTVCMINSHCNSEAKILEMAFLGTPQCNSASLFWETGLCIDIKSA